MQDFTKLKVWQKAHSLTVNIYKITSNFPAEEKFPKGYRCAYGLTNRLPTAIRRSANGGALQRTEEQQYQ